MQLDGAELEALVTRVADAAVSRALTSQSQRLLAPVDEAATMAGVGTSTMWDLIRRGVVETATLGRRRLVVVESLHKLVDERRRAPKEILATPPVGRGRRPTPPKS